MKIKFVNVEGNAVTLGTFLPFDLKTLKLVLGRYEIVWMEI